jgi:hypothetical protein
MPLQGETETSGRAREEDATSVYGYTDPLRANGRVEVKRERVSGDSCGPASYRIPPMLRMSSSVNRFHPNVEPGIRYCPPRYSTISVPVSEGNGIF